MEASELPRLLSRERGQPEKVGAGGHQAGITFSFGQCLDNEDRGEDCLCRIGVSGIMADVVKHGKTRNKEQVLA